jgi:hypothetical protein
MAYHRQTGQKRRDWIMKTAGRVENSAALET